MKKYKKMMNIVGWLFLLGVFIYIAFTWNSLPDQIPAHYNLQGKVDRYGGKANILIMPVIMGIIFIGIAVVERYPNTWNVPVEVREETKDRIYDSMAAMLVTLRVVLICNAFFTTILESRGMHLPAWYLIAFICAILLPLIIDMIYIVKINKKESEVE